MGERVQLYALPVGSQNMVPLSVEIDNNGDVVLRTHEAAPVAYDQTNDAEKQNIVRREPVLIQTHNAVSVAGTNGQALSAIIDCRGYDSIASGMINDASTTRILDVIWYADSGATSAIGSDNLVASAASASGVGRTTVKAPYAKVRLTNGDAANHTMSSWTTLLP